MNYMTIKGVDIADGIGVRVGLYVSGCNRHCKGCHNAEAWAFDAGKPFDDEAMKTLMDALEPDYIDGISILGGEPLEKENLDCVTEIVTRIRETMPDKTIWLYTGYVVDEDEEGIDEETADRIAVLLLMCDVVVDGPFIEEQRDLSIRFRGSRNQRIIDIKRSVRAQQIIRWEEGVKA